MNSTDDLSPALEALERDLVGIDKLADVLLDGTDHVSTFNAQMMVANLTDDQQIESVAMLLRASYTLLKEARGIVEYKNEIAAHNASGFEPHQRAIARRDGRDHRRARVATNRRRTAARRPRVDAANARRRLTRALGGGPASLGPAPPTLLRRIEGST
jgi:hypothetical protein